MSQDNILIINHTKSSLRRGDIMESMSTWSEDQINQRLKEIDQLEKEAGRPKSQLLIGDDDDAYQDALELGWYLEELRDERKVLIELRNKLH